MISTPHLFLFMFAIFALIHLSVSAVALTRFTPSQVDSFYKDGYVFVRGLLGPMDVEYLQECAKGTLKRKGPLDEFVMRNYRKIEFNTFLSDERLRNITRSIPVHQIMEKKKTLIPFLPRALKGGKVRVLKDAFLSVLPGLDGCGWHVDDESFWPTKLENRGSEGVNVWIALSEYKKSRGGGLAIAPTSQAQKWTKKARNLLRSTGRTCSLQELSPELHSSCEALAERTMDMQPGDAIVHSRWLFHRSDPFSEEGVRYHNSSRNKEPLMRYSIRYMPEQSRLSSRFDQVIIDNRFEGMSLKKAGSVFYPLVFGQG